jgi:hypothetical protein
MASIGFDACEHERFHVWRQELAVFGKRRDNQERYQTNEDRETAFDDEYPSMRLAAAQHLIHEALTISTLRIRQYHPSSQGGTR